MTTQQTATIVREFIEEAWNGQQPEAAAKYLAEDFVDHDNRTTSQGLAGMQEWLAQTNRTFDHCTIIEDQLTEGDRSFIRITFRVVQRGEFRGLPASDRSAETGGYRIFRVKDGKISEHWGFIDGNKLVEQLSAASSQ
jgi:steroid delta-isomerase-like uncharacterized protein